MRGKMYLFALPLLFISVMVFPGIHYACASIAAKPLLPYAQMEYATRRTYTVGTTPVTLHVYPGFPRRRRAPGSYFSRTPTRLSPGGGGRCGRHGRQRPRRSLL